jgi:uncharacterized protein
MQQKPINNQGSIPQFKPGTILFMFAWPAVWYMLLIYFFARHINPAGTTTPTWLRMLILILGPMAELSAGLLLLRREGYKLTPASLRNRVNLHWPKDGKAWGVAAAIFVLGMCMSMAMGPVNKVLAVTPGFTVPEWWGAAGNPTVAINSAADVFPDINLSGNYFFVLFYFLIGLVFNIFGEEMYYRGYLLPRMHGVFGRYDWVANGILFTLKHFYQRWMFPGILVGGFCFAFAAGPLGSLPLAMIFHWTGNFLFQMIFLVMAALGVK